jgi:glycosyltransferase involved in cell wall biosynthesis
MGRPIRVAYDARTLQLALRNSAHGGLGGIARYGLTLINSLVRTESDLDFLLLVDRGEVPARLNEIAASSERATLQPVGLPRRILKLKRGRVESSIDLVETRLLSKQIRDLGPDVVHFTDQPPPTLVARPTVVTVFDLVPLIEQNERRGLDDWLRRRAWQRVSRADRAVCISQSTAADAQHLVGISADRTIVCYPGVDTEVFRPGLAAADTSFPALRGRRFFLHTGVLRPRKNPEGLLHAFAKVAESADVDLVCAGPYHLDAAAAEKVVNLATRVGVRNRLHLVGDCTDETLASLYGSAAAAVYPSFYEGFGYPVLEALACGTPCVAREHFLTPRGGRGAGYLCRSPER